MLTKEIEVDGKKLKIRNNGERVTNDGIEAGDIYEGGMINPSYSKLTRKMVDYDYVKTVLEDCRLILIASWSILEHKLLHKKDENVRKMKDFGMKIAII